MMGPPAQRPELDASAPAWAATARAALGRLYPYSSGHVATGPDDVDITPDRLHPAFHGALDWHSSVHLHWSLLVLRRQCCGALSQAGELEPVEQLLKARLHPDAVQTEADYLRARPSFERPYGWAWAAMLAAEAGVGQPGEHPHAAALESLAEVIADNVLAWLPRQVYPVRHGKHQNDAFALTLLRRAHARLQRPDVVAAIDERATDWFGADRDWSTADEPGGTDFLSPALSEALLMTEVLGERGRDWLAGFLPDLVAGQATSLFEVPLIRDATDGQFVHLAGLALSRAWQLRALAGSVPTPAPLLAAAQAQEAFGSPLVTDGDFMATHWLVSFALLAHPESSC